MSRVPGSRSSRGDLRPIDGLWGRIMCRCRRACQVFGRSPDASPFRITIRPMRRVFLLTVLAVLLSLPAFAQNGAVVVVGGGNTGPDIIGKALELAGGSNAIVTILPQSSAEPDGGDTSGKVWRGAGGRGADEGGLPGTAAARAGLA